MTDKPERISTIDSRYCSIARTVIPLQFEEIGDLGNTTVDDTIGSGVEIFGEEICQEGRGGRANLRWLQYCRTSGGYGAHQWLEAKEDRVIPGSVITNIKQGGIADRYLNWEGRNYQNARDDEHDALRALQEGSRPVLLPVL
jgi:hypothetical protein